MEEQTGLPARREAGNIPADTAALRRYVAELGRMLAALGRETIRLQELVETRLTITDAQTRSLRRQIVARAKKLCGENGLEYARYGRRYRYAIYGELKRMFSVDAVGDLPAAALEQARQVVAAWESYRLALELRQKAAERKRENA